MKGFSLFTATVLVLALNEGSYAGRLPSADALMTRHRTIQRRSEFNSYPKNGTISVTGVGRVDIYSDLTSIRFSIYKSEKCDLSKPSIECEASKAQDRLNKASTQVVNALTDDPAVTGVYTDGMDFSQVKEYYTDEEVKSIADQKCSPCPSYIYSGESKEYLSAYKTNADFLAIVKTSDQGRLLDLIVQNGANVIQDISSYISPDAMNQANIDAVTAGAQDALDQANAVVDQLPEGPLQAAVSYTEEVDIPFNDDSASTIAADIDDRKPVFNEDGTIIAAYKTIAFLVEVKLFFADE